MLCSWFLSGDSLINSENESANNYSETMAALTVGVGQEHWGAVWRYYVQSFQEDVSPTADYSQCSHEVLKMNEFKSNCKRKQSTLQSELGIKALDLTQYGETEKVGLGHMEHWLFLSSWNLNSPENCIMTSPWWNDGDESGIKGSLSYLILSQLLIRCILHINYLPLFDMKIFSNPSLLS
jgi:hypothetical protein